MFASGDGRSFHWRRSRYCSDGSCVEVAVDDDGGILLRDGKLPDGPVLAFPAGSWKAFVSAVNDGHFDDW